MKKVLLAFSLVFLSGCATEAVLPSQAKLAPTDRLLKFQRSIAPDDSTLIVVRDKGYLGSGCYAGVYLNDQKSAILDPGEKATFHLPPGEWSVAVKGEGKMCVSDSVPVGNYVRLTRGETKAVRIFSAPSGNIDVRPLPLR